MTESTDDDEKGEAGSGPSTPWKDTAKGAVAPAGSVEPAAPHPVGSGQELESGPEEEGEGDETAMAVDGEISEEDEGKWVYVATVCACAENSVR